MLINLRNLSALTVAAITLVTMSSTASAHPGHGAPSDELNPLHYFVNPDHAGLTVVILLLVGGTAMAVMNRKKKSIQD